MHALWAPKVWVDFYCDDVGFFHPELERLVLAMECERRPLVENVLDVIWVGRAIIHQEDCQLRHRRVGWSSVSHHEIREVFLLGLGERTENFHITSKSLVRFGLTEKKVD